MTQNLGHVGLLDEIQYVGQNWFPKCTYWQIPIKILTYDKTSPNVNSITKRVICVHKKNIL